MKKASIEPEEVCFSLKICGNDRLGIEPYLSPEEHSRLQCFDNLPYSADITGGYFTIYRSAIVL